MRSAVPADIWSAARPDGSNFHSVVNLKAVRAASTSTTRILLPRKLGFCKTVPVNFNKTSFATSAAKIRVFDVWLNASYNVPLHVESYCFMRPTGAVQHDEKPPHRPRNTHHAETLEAMCGSAGR